MLAAEIMWTWKTDCPAACKAAVTAVEATFGAV
jgi:hypothetical protein